MNSGVSRWGIFGKRFGLFAMAFLVMFAYIQTLAPPASAAVTPGGGGGSPLYQQMNPDQLAQSYALYYGIVKCVTGINSISNSDVLNGGFNGANGAYLYSYYIDSTDGMSECQTVERLAIDLWQYGSLDNALQDWGYKPPTNGGDWTNSNPGANTAQAIRNRVYGGSQPVLPSTSQYLYWDKTLHAACELSSPIEYSKASTSLKAALTSPSNTKYVRVTEVASDYQSVIDRIYTVGHWQSVTRYAPLNSPLHTSTSLNCQQIADKVTANAAAYRVWAASHKAIADQIANTLDPSSTDTPDNSCALDGIGWIVCPVATFIAKLNDSLYGVIKNFLVIDTRMFSTTPSKSNANAQTYQIWQTFRNIANVVFIIVFLIIIYSEMVRGSRG